MDERACFSGAVDPVGWADRATEAAPEVARFGLDLRYQRNETSDEESGVESVITPDHRAHDVRPDPGIASALSGNVRPVQYAIQSAALWLVGAAASCRGECFSCPSGLALQCPGSASGLPGSRVRACR
jgi:hypothetical protein